MTVGSKAPLTLSFVMGSRQAVPWLESATSGLEQGQTATLVPECSDDSAVVHVTLNKLTPAKVVEETDTENGSNGNAQKDPYKMSASVHRKEGNDFVKSASNVKSYRAACLPYYRALQAPDVDDSISSAVHSNLSLVGLRTMDWTLAIAHADAAQLHLRELDQPSLSLAKVFFRRASAFYELKHYIPALAQFNRAHELSPQDSSVIKERDHTHKCAVDLLGKGKQDFAEVYNVMLQSPLFENPLLV